MKRFLSVLIVMVMMLPLVPVIARAKTSGTCGDSLVWTLDDEGTLTISGTGKMTDYGSSSNSPFYHNDQINTVVIENGVTSIGDYAFYYCSNVTKIIIPDSVTGFGYGAFLGTDYYDDETNWEDGVLYIGNHLIEVNNEFNNSEYEIKKDTISIGDYAFWKCSNLTSIIIPDSVTTISEYAFYYCSSLENIVISDNVMSIGYGAFFNTAYFDDESNWDRGVLYLEDYLIKADWKEIDGEYEIKKGTITIADGAFNHCANLNSVIIPEGIKIISNNVFEGCESLASITIPNSVTVIGDMAFYGCGNLMSIEMPNDVTTIGHSAFYDCNSLTSITIPDKVTTIRDFTFYGCYKLESIILSDFVMNIGDGHLIVVGDWLMYITKVWKINGIILNLEIVMRI